MKDKVRTLTVSSEGMRTYINVCNFTHRKNILLELSGGGGEKRVELTESQAIALAGHLLSAVFQHAEEDNAEPPKEKNNENE